MWHYIRKNQQNFNNFKNRMKIILAIKTYTREALDIHGLTSRKFDNSQ
jgi:hypothetical protein